MTDQTPLEQKVTEAARRTIDAERAYYQAIAEWHRAVEELKRSYGENASTETKK